MKKSLPSKELNKFYIHVIGCQQNVHDGIKLTHALAKIGLIESTETDADIIIVIACAVRQTAVDRIFGKLKNWKSRKIIVSGCVLDSDKKKLAREGVAFCDIEKPEELSEILELDSGQLNLLMDESAKYSGSVPIMFGCDNFCSYCATPYTRGRERSRSFDQIVKEVEKLISIGSMEILLLGQNVNSYSDPETGKGFEQLIKHLNSLDGNFIVGFTSNHPKDMTDGIIEAVANLPKIKKEIHLPLQSGSDKILRAMNRPYSLKEYLQIIKKIQKANPSIAITTDVIVGFPGETEEDFQETVKVFRQVGYKMAYINKYSPRKGTAAYKLGNPISWKEKQRRWHELDKVLSLTRRQVSSN